MLYLLGHLSGHGPVQSWPLKSVKLNVIWYLMTPGTKLHPVLGRFEFNSMMIWIQAFDEPKGALYITVTSWALDTHTHIYMGNKNIYLQTPYVNLYISFLSSYLLSSLYFVQRGPIYYKDKFKPSCWLQQLYCVWYMSVRK